MGSFVRTLRVIEALTDVQFGTWHIHPTHQDGQGCQGGSKGGCLEGLPARVSYTCR